MCWIIHRKHAAVLLLYCCLALRKSKCHFPLGDTKHTNCSAAFLILVFHDLPHCLHVASHFTRWRQRTTVNLETIFVLLNGCLAMYLCKTCCDWYLNVGLPPLQLVSECQKLPMSFKNLRTASQKHKIKFEKWILLNVTCFSVQIKKWTDSLGTLVTNDGKSKNDFWSQGLTRPNVIHIFP